MKNSVPSRKPPSTINTVAELALQLEVKIEVLQEVSSDINNYCHKKMEVDAKGKERVIYPPKQRLRGIQKAIQKQLLDRISIPSAFHGGLKKHSTRTNAEPHTGKQLVAEYDIKDFFPSVSHKQVYRAFITQGCTPDVARLLTQLTTVDGHLPQGFLTSPKLSVLVLLPIERRLSGLFKKHGLDFTIWIDNFTVSGSFAIKSLEKPVRKIFADHGFTLKEAKYTYSQNHQTVTGATVNTKVAPPKETVRSLRKTKYLIEKYGVQSYIKRYAPDTTPESLRTALTGKLSYLISLDREKYSPLNKWFQEKLKT